MDGQGVSNLIFRVYFGFLSDVSEPFNTMRIKSSENKQHTSGRTW